MPLKRGSSTTPSTSTGSEHHHQHTSFIHSITQLLEDMDKWSKDGHVTKEDFAKDTRTSLLHILKTGIVYPQMSFFALEPPSVRLGGE